MTTTDVLIVGAGPTGLTLATSLLLQGVDVVLVDRQAEGANTSRAAGVNARTLQRSLQYSLDVTRRLVNRVLKHPASPSATAPKHCSTSISADWSPPIRSRCWYPSRPPNASCFRGFANSAAT